MDEKSNCNGNYSSTVDYLEFLYKFHGIFSKIVKNFHPLPDSFSGFKTNLLRFSLKIAQKCLILVYFQKITKPGVKFPRVLMTNTNCWEILRNFDKNSLEKLNFYLFLEKLLLKIEPSEIISFFYNNFFNFGGDVPCVPPGGATGLWYYFPLLWIFIEFRITSTLALASSKISQSLLHYLFLKQTAGLKFI